MNDEIKEILEYFKDDIDYLEEELKYPNFKGRYITIRDKECEYLRKLLDYITNLQKENDKLQEQFKDWKKEIEKEKKYYLCDRTDCCGRIKNSKKYSSIYHELKELKSDLLYVLEQLDGYLDKGWTIDLNFTDIREKYKEDIKEYENWK